MEYKKSTKTVFLRLHICYNLLYKLFLIYIINIFYPSACLSVLGGGTWEMENIFEMVRDRAISSEFLTHRVVQQYSMPRGIISVFATFGGHLGF